MPGIIFIHNLYPKVDVTDLCEAFGKYGRILSANIEYGKMFTSLGKARICYFDTFSADIAVKEMNGKKKLGNPIQVKVVKCGNVEKCSDDRQIDVSKVFVNNLNSSWDECDVMKIFKKYGDIDEVKISETYGKSNGYGFVKFAEPISAKRAIEEMKEESMNPRNIIVEPFIPFKMREKIRQSVEFAKDLAVERNNLHVKNLEKDVTENELTKLFRSFGSILSVKIPLDESGKSKGFGFVCFEEEEDAANAREQMDNYKYKSKYLKVNFNQKKFARQKYLKAIKTDPEIREFKGVRKGVRGTHLMPQKSKETSKSIHSTYSDKPCEFEILGRGDCSKAIWHLGSHINHRKSNTLVT